MCRVTLAVNTFMAASLDMPLHASHASHLTLLPGIDIMPTFNAHASVNAQRQTSFIPANSHYGQRCLVLVQALPLSLNVVPTSCPVCPPVLACSPCVIYPPCPKDTVANRLSVRKIPGAAVVLSPSLTCLNQPYSFNCLSCDSALMPAFSPDACPQSSQQRSCHTLAHGGMPP